MNYIVLHSTIYGSSEKVALLIMLERFFILAPSTTVGLKKPETVKEFVPITNDVHFLSADSLQPRFLADCWGEEEEEEEEGGGGGGTFCFKG